MNPLPLIRRLEETYDDANRYLVQYFKAKPLGVSDHWMTLSQHWDRWPDLVEEAGSSDEELGAWEDDGNYEAVHDVCHRVEELMDDAAKDEAAEVLMQHDPHEAPTWAHLSAWKPRLLPPSTWLVHWSRNADDVAEHGFRRGVEDIDRLGLTTYLGQSAKSRPGYNFAFQLHNGANDDRKYGDACVVFQSAGLEAYHGGDDEDQVIFWGPSITSAPVLVAPDAEASSESYDPDKWCVYGRRHGRTGRPLVRLDSPGACFAWIVAHGAQYRRPLHRR